MNVYVLAFIIMICFIFEISVVIGFIVSVDDDFEDLSILLKIARVMGIIEIVIIVLLALYAICFSISKKIVCNNSKNDFKICENKGE